MNRRQFLGAGALLSAGAIATPSALAQQMDDGTDIRTPTAEELRLSNVVLPSHRILSYYGFPGNELMGILGEYDKDTLLSKLKEQAAAYEQVDPSRPFKPAFEVIASVAQADPQADNSYLTYTDDAIIQDYVDYTKEKGILLILDAQFGRHTVKQELDALNKWLKYEHVHIALDPEFAVKEGEVPGQDLGTIDAADITYAQKRLAGYAKQHDLPPKILVVHQFNYYSISNKDKIQEVDGVQFVLEVDGWGPPDEKRDTYRVIAGGKPIQYYGFKLWYQQDVPLMSPSDVLGLNPSPDIVIYQ